METEFYAVTERIEKLLENLKNRALSDRTDEWFRQEELADVAMGNEHEPVIVRKALAIKEMLTKMCDPKISEHTHTYEIQDGELLVGVIPMGSNGLGKVFPNYLTEDEKRAASYTNRTEMSLLGHNTVNYERLLSGGLKSIIEQANQEIGKLNNKLDITEMDDENIEVIPLMESTRNVLEVEKRNSLVSKLDFYRSVVISCEAVIEYAHNYGELARKKAEQLKAAGQLEQSAELEQIADICLKVPEEKPNTFQEALQSIYFFHLALHASLNLISLGRLDQSIYPYYEQDLKKCETEEEKENFRKKATEYLECMIIKCAGRLNLNTQYLLSQDHMDNNAALGVHPYYLDQRAGVNNFLQNIIIGGLTPEGAPAENEVSYRLLNAYANVNLSTPGIYVRLSKDSSEKLKMAVARCLERTKTLPCILNDDTIIPAFNKSLGIYESTPEGIQHVARLANDYCVDGCWEPILNGEGDWTFGMQSCLTIFQCAINQGAVLDTNIGMLRGSKVSFRSKQVTNYEEFKDSFTKYMQFFVDQSTFTLYQCYTMDEFVIPSPLFSAVLGECMKRGRDKSWGGVGFNIGGTILTGVPDTINNIAAIKKFVFDEQKYTIEEVKEAMVNNFKEPLISAIYKAERWKEMKHDFDYGCNKFGDGSEEIAEIGRFVMNTFLEAVDKSREFTDRVYLKSIRHYSKEEQNQIRRLRKISGYSGSCFQRKLGKDFVMRFTAGCGTFEGYPQQGLGVVATANRNSNDPIISNFSPAPGTIKNGIANVFKTLGQLPMDRMSAGAVTDLCINEKDVDREEIVQIIDGFIDNSGCMLTLTFGDVSKYQKAYTLSYDLIYGDDIQKKYAMDMLPQYSDMVVRVGGWQAPFVSMSLDQQKDYISRFIGTLN